MQFKHSRLFVVIKSLQRRLKIILDISYDLYFNKTILDSVSTTDSTGFGI